MDALFGDRLAPLTDDIGFVQTGSEQAAHAWAGVLAELQTSSDEACVVRKATGDLEALLKQLPPLAKPDTRFLFAATRSTWTALFTNGLRGADIQGPMSRLALALGCRTIRATCIANARFRLPDGRAGRRYGATIWTVFTPTGNFPENVERSVYAANDGGRWRFGAHGNPFAFEDQERYAAERTPQRFPPELLDRYLKAMGIDAYSNNFYAGSGHLVQRLAEPVARATLDEARRDSGLPTDG
jgi:hypothetical protein